MTFWKELTLAMENMGFERSKAEPCLYLKRHKKYGLLIFLSWVDDLLCFGVKEGVSKCIYELKRRFDTDDVGELDEYVGCKINHDKEKRSIRFTQPVMIQSFQDEFELLIPSSYYVYCHSQIHTIAEHLKNLDRLEIDLGAFFSELRF